LRERIIWSIGGWKQTGLFAVCNKRGVRFLQEDVGVYLWTRAVLLGAKKILKKKNEKEVGANGTKR